MIDANFLLSRLRLASATGEIVPGPLAVGLIALLAFFAWDTLSIPETVRPSYDDRELIVENPVVEGTLPASAAFDQDYFHHIGDAGHYRPLATLLLRWDRSRAGGPDGEIDWRVFRRTNAVLHVMIVLLLGVALLRLDRHHGLPLPWFGLGVFAVHPAGADVVAWIAGRTSLVSAVGAAGGALIATFVTRKRAPGRALVLALASGLLGTGVALLGKEDGVVLVVALPIVCAWCGGRRAGWAALAGALVATGLVAALRASALGSAMPSSPAAPLAETALLERVTIGLAAWWQGLASILAPWVDRPPFLDVRDLTSPPGAAVRAGLLVGAFLALALALRRCARAEMDGAQHPKAGAGLAGLALGVVCIAPLVQIVPAGEIFAPRFLYQPLLLGVFVTSAAAHVVLLPLRHTFAPNPLRVAAILGCAALVPQAASVYASRASYWQAHLPQHESDPRVWNALGNAAREDGDLGAARGHFERAAELDPSYSRPRTNLGTLAIERGDLIEAERWLREAVATGPDNPVAHANLGNVLLRLRRPGEAVAPYREAARLAPGRGALHRGLGRALMRSGDLVGARAAAGKALDLNPGDHSAGALLEEIQAAIDGARSEGGL